MLKYQYNQLSVGANACGLFAFITAASNLRDYELFHQDLQDMYDSTGRKNNGALPIVNMKQAKERWNNKFKKKMVVSFLPFGLSEAFDKIKAGRTAIVHIRVNEQFVRDALDGRIDNLIVDKTTGGHALCLSYDKVKQDYYFTDNYLGVKQKNEYYISEDIIKAMIKKGLMFDSAYYAIKGKVLSPK